MTLSVKQTQAKKMAEVRAALARPQYVHLSSRILVHEPAPSGSKPCPCCGSVFASIAEEHDDGELLIDRSTGRRILPTQLRPETWTRAVAVAERHDIVYRVSRDQYPLLVDDTDRHILLAGTHRSGKTTLALLFAVRQWVRRGGKLRRFWFVGESHEKAYELVKTVFEGDGNAPPILPSSLAIRRPISHKAADLNTLLIDGSLFQVRRFNADPTAGGLKSRPIVCAVTDEAAEMKHKAALTALTGRCVDLRGRLFLATSPVGGSFLKDDIVDKCDEWSRMTDDHPAKRGGEHIGARWISGSISLTGNPWLDQEGVQRDLKAQDQTSPTFKRDWLGLWVSDFGKFWVYDDSRHTFNHEARRLADMMPLVNRIAKGGAYVRRSPHDLEAVWTWGIDEQGQPLPERPQRRITDVIARRLFQTRDNPGYRSLKATNVNFLLGSDINGGALPSNTVIVEVTADADAPEDKERWHYWVLDVKETFGDSLKHAKELSSTAWTRIWNAAATESPYKGCGMIVDPQALFRNPTAHRYGGNPQGLIEEYAHFGFDVRAPQYVEGIHPLAHLPRGDSHAYVKRLLDEGRLHISSRCATTLIKSFHTQEASPSGREPEKAPMRDGPVDALRYILHACAYGGGALS